MFIFKFPPPDVEVFDIEGSDEKYYFENGNMYHIPLRTKFSHPYNYDPITLIDTGKKSIDSVYSDRMSQWDNKKFCEYLKVGELRFAWSDAKAVTKLCRDYFDNPTLEVTKVVEICNQSTGFPVWHIEFCQEN